MSREVFIVGVGMTSFSKPGGNADYGSLGLAALTSALADSGLEYRSVGAGYAGYVYGDSTSGQGVFYRAGMTGIPIINVNNNCATGSTALYLAAKGIEHGEHECALAVGFEQMRPGALGSVYDDRPDPLARFLDALEAKEGGTEVPMALRLFGTAGLAYQRAYGASDETFARITVKARSHAAHNPLALLRTPVTVEEVLGSPRLFGNLTRLQCCPPTCGAAAAVLCTEDFARRHGITPLIRIAGQSLVTDRPDSFDDAMALVGGRMAARAAQQVYTQSGLGPDVIDVVELHDCFTTSEIISYEALGIVPPGGSEQFVADGQNTYGGRIVVNPSGGLLSKGHPLGATGLAQCAELVWQLRGTAGARQVQGARIALQHNVGLGGACVVTLYERMAA